MLPLRANGFFSNCPASNNLAPAEPWSRSTQRSTRVASWRRKHMLRLFLPIVRLQYPFVALRGHVLETRLKERCLLFRQNRALEYLLQILVAAHTVMFQRIGLRIGCNGRLNFGRLCGARYLDGRRRIEPAELHRLSR